MPKPPQFADTQPDISLDRSRGKGMPAKTAREGRERVEKEDTPQDAAAEASLSLPHERDQSTDMTADKPDPTIKQAKKDIDSGKQDTGKEPEMNRAYQKQK